MSQVVVYDANVLYPSTLRDVLIRVGLARLVQPKWTERILDEVFRNLRTNRPDLEPSRLDRTRRLMNDAIRDVTVTESFIPTHRTIDFTDVIEGIAPKRMGRSTTYQVPYTMAFPLGITAAVVGAAEGVRRCYLEGQQQRVLVTGARAVDDPYALYAYSDAAAEIHAARTALLDNANRMYDLAAKGHEFTFDERAIGRRVQTAAAWRAVRAADEIVARAGGYALRRDNPLQRFWRDAHAGLNHAIHVPSTVYHASALSSLGRSEARKSSRRKFRASAL